MTKPRIAVIGLKGLPAFGGAATVGENIIAELKDKYDFTVYSVRSHTTNSGNQGNYNQIVFKVFFLKKLNIFFYYCKSMIHSVFFAKYDLIHLHHIDGAFILPVLRLKYKVVCTSHAQPYISEKWSIFVNLFFKINEKLALILSNSITTVALSLKDEYQRKSKKQIYYIPNGINLNPQVDNSHLNLEKYMLFAAGRIIPLKGLHLLLEAIHMSKLGMKLIIIGNLDQMPEYKTKIIELAKGLNVEFIPLIKEKHKLLRYVADSEIFIFPSLSENMSIMLLEAASMQVNLICSDISANTAVFNNDEALFFKSGEIIDLCDKIKFAINEQETMRKKSAAAYKRLTDQYNWGLISAQYSNLYETLLR